MAQEDFTNARDNLVDQILLNRGEHPSQRWGISFCSSFLSLFFHCPDEEEFPSQAFGISVDQTIRVPWWRWVNVAKSIRNNYSNGTAMLEKGESCGLQKGGELRVLGFSVDSSITLVENLTGGVGTPCPRGAMFFIDTEELAVFDDLYEEYLRLEGVQDDFVDQILSNIGKPPFQAFGVSVDQTIRVPKWKWVNVVERVESNYTNGPAMLEKGESCGIQEGGELRVLSFSPDSSAALVENLTGGPGTSCPTGVKFVISAEELAGFDDLYEENLRLEGIQDNLVDQILSDTGERPSQVFGISVDQTIRVPGWKWVNVAESIRNNYTNGTAMLEKGKSCGLQEGGELRVLGFSPDSRAALMENLTGGLGTPCPAGAKFLIDTEELAGFGGFYEEILRLEGIPEEGVPDDLVDQILSDTGQRPSLVFGISVDQTIRVPGGKWVNVVESVNDTNGTAMLVKGKSCRLQEGGELRVLGFSPDDSRLALVENLTGGLGTHCPSGVMFLEEVAVLRWWNTLP